LIQILRINPSKPADAGLAGQKPGALTKAGAGAERRTGDIRNAETAGRHQNVGNGGVGRFTAR
jgi:hypothetical protein